VNDDFAMRRCGDGNFNPVLGACVCPIGRNGTACEVDALPACRSTTGGGGPASCAVPRPQHCDCLAQCAASGAFAAHLHRYCFTRADGVALSDVPPVSVGATFWEWSDDPAGEAAWRPPTKQVPRRTALAVRFRDDLKHVPFELCDGRCSERGACVMPAGRAPRRAARGSCRCDAHYSGARCDRHESPYCWNDCSGRGECIDGFCRCRPPFYGPACALGAADAAQAPGGFRIHVYDLPPVVTRRWRSASDDDPIFNTYHSFMRALLASPALLSARPEDAALLLAPAFATNMEGLVQYYAHMQRYIEGRHPELWRRRGGRDHVWWGSGDGAGCDFNHAGQLARLRQSIFVAHYFKFNTTSTSCGDATKDVAVPPHVPAVHSADFLRRGEAAAAARPTLFFFAGNVPESGEPGFDARDDKRLADEAYSEGVRQLVWKHVRRAPGFKVVARSPTYMADWGESKFCLAPQGVGWGVRLLWAVGGGCVPVLASSEVSPWFDDVLPYERFAVVGVPKLALRDLPDRLRALASSADFGRTRAALLRARPLLLWPPHGFAFNLTMRQLCVRAARIGRGDDGEGQADARESTCDALLPEEAARRLEALGRRGGGRRAKRRGRGAF